MSLEFDRYAATGNEILDLLAKSLKTTKAAAGSILCAILYAMRSRISLDESLQVVAQLPMALKAVYINGWDPWHSVHRIRRLDEFVNEMRKQDKLGGQNNFESDDFARLAIVALFNTFNHFLSPGEFRNIIAVLPHEVKNFVSGRIGHKTIPA